MFGCEYGEKKLLWLQYSISQFTIKVLPWYKKLVALVPKFLEIYWLTGSQNVSHLNMKKCDEILVFCSA